MTWYGWCQSDEGLLRRLSRCPRNQQAKRHWRLPGRRVAEQSAIILANLDQIAEDLMAGAVVVIGDDWIRIRRLPMPG
jgi:hypothetical protein